MIVYDLACICGYTFEGWFQDRTDFDTQLHASYLICPKCSGREIRKILSPVRYKSSQPVTNTQAIKEHQTTVTREDAEKALVVLQKYVEENFENVGPQLAKEALKIHYGVSEPRNIRGVTTESEEKKLQEEGINLLKIPMLQSDDSVN